MEDDSFLLAIADGDFNSCEVESYENLLEIEKIAEKDLNYEDFLWKFMDKNLPVRISLDLTEWDSYTNWIDHQNKILNADYLKQKIGNVQVPVAKCCEKYFDSHRKIEMRLYDYLDSLPRTNDSLNMDLLYLKDWHLQKQQPDYLFYTTPEYFGSDFLNEYLSDTNQDDYKFCYIGPKGTYTPFHADVFSSYSWSVNIFGRKCWIMMVPGEENKLRDQFGNLPFEIDEKVLDEKRVQYFKFRQEAGEALFVPSNWHHQVVNEVDTISINHNWVNACNLKFVWEAMKLNHEKVVKEIDDCREMEAFEVQCQIMLKSLFGLDYKGLLTLLEHVIAKRINALKTGESFKTFNKYWFNKSHLLFDLKRILAVVREVQEDKDIAVIGLSSICDKLINQINELLNC